MSARIAARFAACLVFSLGGAGCAREPLAPTLTLGTVGQLSSKNTASLAYQDDAGSVFVTVVDKHGDARVHRLDFTGATKGQALELLMRKQAELEQRR